MIHLPTGPHFPRSPADIVTRMKEASGFLDFTGEVLADYLSFDDAAPVRSGAVTREQWEAPITELQGYGGAVNKPRPIAPDDAEFILLSARAYMTFAWTKVEDHRGISASRSAQKLTAWLWLLGWDTAEVVDDTNRWGQYGAGVLADISKCLGFDIPTDEWATRMIAGLPCVDGCDGGCGQ